MESQTPVTDAPATSASPAGTTFRPATPADIPEMVELINAAFEVETFFVNRPRTNAPQLEEHFRSGHFLLAERPQPAATLGPALLASLYYEPRGERGYIGMLAVRLGQQRSGLGRAIMQAAEELLRQAGCSVAELSVVNLRTNLLRVYGKLGYAANGFMECPEELTRKLTMRVQLIRMEKPL